MSYEHCEIHDCDATDGCEQCEREESDRQRLHAPGVCFACGKVIPAGELRCSECGVDLKLVVVPLPSRVAH